MNSVQPKGRLKYGTYMSKSNIYSKVSSSFYNGNTSTGGGTPASGVTPDPVETCVLLLNHNSFTFDRSVLAVKPQTDTIQVIGYRGTEMREVFVSNLSGLIDEDDVSTTTQSPTYDITGLTSGMTVTVSGNGSSACTISIEVDSSITVSKGTLLIPVSMCLDANGLEDNYLIWKGSNDENTQALGGTSGSLYSTVLEYYWELDSEAQSSYVLDLTNDSAGINVDSSGNVLAGATRPTCKAILYYGQEVVTGATFGITTNAAAAASGVSINTSTGVLTFGNNFNFVGSSLEITVSASYLGHTSIKIMTVSKNYPGADGTGATTRWIVPSASQIKYDPNLDTFDPTGIGITVMVQVNDEQPVADNTTVFWYDWDKSSLLQHTGRTGTVIDVDNGAVNKSYLTVGLKNTEGVYYEIETIPVLSDGMNGSNGENGANGENAYRLDLSNEMEYVNADYNGTVIDGQAQYLSCTATLYYGSETATGVSYSLKQSYNGISINQSGELSFTEDYKNNFSSDDVFSIRIQAKVDNIVRGAAVMKLVKNKPGAPGDNAVRYWLSPTADAIKVSKDETAVPSTISCKAYKQVGGGTPVLISSNPSIYWSYDNDPKTIYDGQAITIDANKNYITFQLLEGDIQYDIETVPILHDGKDGQSRKGAAVLGPTEWTSALQRRWHSGNENAADAPTEEDKLFLDIIMRVVDGEKIYYYCNTSYSQSATTTEWGTVSQYWTQTDEQYEFVASKVLLADNAYINFMTGNEIYLRDSGGTVTAGAAGGNGISFWAGGPENKISDAPFQVNYDGSLKSTKGTFGCLTIGEDNSGHSSFFGHTVGNGYEYELNMSPAMISFKGATDSGTPQEMAEVVAICPSRNDEAIGGGDYAAAINIISDESTGTTPAIQKIAISTNETIKAARLSQKTNSLSKNMEGMPAGYGGAVSTPGLFGLEIVFQTSTPSAETYFTKDVVTGTWKFLEMDTGFHYNDYPYVAVQNSVSAMDADNIGYWAYYKTENGAKIWSGIAGPNITRKKSGIMYIQV